MSEMNKGLKQLVERNIYSFAYRVILHTCAIEKSKFEVGAHACKVGNVAPPPNEIDPLELIRIPSFKK